MRDEMDARIWGEHHGGLGEAASRIAAQIKVGLLALHRIQFDAPWRHLPKQEH